MILKKIKVALLSLAALSTVLIPLAVQTSVSAQIDQDSKNAACEGLTGVGRGCDNAGASTSVGDLIKDVINILSLVIGIAAVIMIIIGGLRYVLSGGDSSSLTSAKNTILYALIGLAIAALAQVLVRFVLGRVS